MRHLRRQLRLALVLMLCLSLSVDPASACHWLVGRWMNRCCPAPTYCSPSPNYCAPVNYCGGGWSSGVVTSVDCGCGDSVVVGHPTVIHDGAIVDETVQGSTTSPTPTWSSTDPATDRAVNKPAEPEQLPESVTPAPELADDVSPADTTPLPEPEMAASDDELFDDLGGRPSDDAALDLPMEEPADDDLFATPADEPMAEEPAMEEPSDDLFGAPSDEPAAADDDLFGAPADEPEATEPTMEEPAGDDLFGAPADEPAPADDDLFGAPADEPEVTEPAMEEPAADDLFGAPADEPAPADDDLFGAPADEPELTEPAMEQPAADDLFGAPAEEPAPADDDLFGPPAGDEAPTDEPATDEEDDLFGDFGAVLEQPGGLSSLALRHWVDNTGQYTVDARLIAVVDGHVRLLKANGRTTTVAFSRLSNEDLSFVNRQAAAQQAKTLSQTAQR